jgi:hypothetical protein
MAEQDLYRVISSGAMYLYLFGQYWYIADPATLDGVFGSNPDVTDVASVSGPMGPVIASGSGLWQPEGNPRMYFVCTGNTPITAYWITNPQVLAYYQFHGPVQTCSNQVINDWLAALITYGSDIGMP